VGAPARRRDRRVEWQRWVDALTRAGISRSRIDELLAIVRGVYAYATRSTRRIWTCNDPTRYLDLPARDEQKRMRVAPVPEAHQLLAALPDDVAMPYAIAIGAGLRRSELRLLDWSDVLWDANKVLVRDSKSEAGRLRRAPVSKLGSAKAMAPRENEELAAQLARVVKGLAGTLEDIRELSRGIHPAILSKGGLVPALRTLERRSAVPVKLDLAVDRRLGDHVEAGAYYVVSEALTNAAKHALPVDVNGGQAPAGNASGAWSPS
jgi:hypothetical protein